MENVYCTVISKLRLYQAVALICSMHEVMSGFTLYALCVDDATYKILTRMAFNNVRLIRLEEIKNETLNRLENERKLNEYCWTLKPFLIEYLFENYAYIKRITYIDADIFFFSSPEVIFELQQQNSVLLSRGDIRIPSLNNKETTFIQNMLGQYNSGFISFLRDDSALECIRWWKEQCLLCCHSLPKEGKFGDQKYLDEMPNRFKNVAEIKTPGVNLGHWNSHYYNYGFYKGAIYIDLDKLICYHFSGFRVVNEDKIILIHEADKMNSPFFYSIYMDILKDIVEGLKAIEPGFDGYANKEDLGPHFSSFS